jgi:hypothetical protein
MTHQLYKSSDFTNEQYYNNLGFARMVIDGGLCICSICSAAESELDDHATCEDFNLSLQENN